ncbi:MAG: hypothetical protein JSW28_02060 [Thermoplasmata archaeon]|nr:MAG: hypothetical protein JSW28_02060 [Thermoplasmata archaeon]
MPKQKKLKIRTGARTASKAQEKELVSKAKKMRKNPNLVVPRCEHEGKCALDKVRRQVKRVQGAADDTKRLSKMAKSGDQLARAYAATLLVASSEKAPYLAVLRTPFGEVAYAMRGTVKKEKLIGVQHYDKPKWRLLSVLDLAKKRGLHIYSTKSGLICMGKDGTPPGSFVKEMIDALKYSLKKEGNAYICEHLSKNDVKNKKATIEPFTLADWKEADIKIAVCDRCVSKKGSIVASITQNMAVPKPNDAFDVEVVTVLLCKSDCEHCEGKEQLSLDEELRNEYFDGKISDYKLIEKHLENYQAFLSEGEEKIYVLDENCYGNDMDAFLDELNCAEEERLALAAILEKIEEPVVVSKATPNKLLNIYWADFGKDALLAIVGDEETAEKLFNSADITKTSPSQVLREATILTKERDIISALPEYDVLPPIAKFADSIARTYMTQGKEDAVRAIERYKGGDTRIKSVAYAFLLAMDHGASKQWQYSKTEIDFAHFLKEHASELLRSKPDEYHDNLQGLLSATGSTKKLTRD